MSNFTAAVRQVAVLIDRWHWVLLALAAPFLLFPTPATTPLMLIVPGLWIVARLTGHEAVPRTPLNATLLLFSIMVLVSLYATYDIAISLSKIAGVILGLGVFFAIARSARYSRGWWLSFLILIMLGIGIAGLSLLGTQWIAKIVFLTPLISRLPPTLTGLPGAEEGLHPNEVAGALLWVVPSLIVLVVLYNSPPRRRQLNRERVAIRVGSVLAALFVVGVFILTQSRSGYIALVISTLSIIALPLLSRTHWPRLVALIVMVLVIIAALVLILWSSTSSLYSSDPSAPDDQALSLDTLEGRVELWSRAIYAIQDYPFTGMGMNTFRHVVHVIYPLFLVAPGFDVGHAHNEFLQAALDLGLPGLIAFIALYIGAFGMLRKIWYASPSAFPTRALTLGLGGGLLAHVIYGLTDAVALGAKPGILFWLLLGLIAALFRQTQPASSYRTHPTAPDAPNTASI